MKVILLQDIPKIGKKNDTIEVKEGYARNYLIPRGLAWDANNKNINLVQEQLKRIMSNEKKEKQEAEALANRINSLNCTLYCQAHEEDKLFGSVSALDIYKFLQTQGINNIDKKDILLEEPIKNLGVFFVDIKVHKDVKTTLKVWIVKEEQKTIQDE